jgi:outer membrane lipoprotein-sorting protein
MTAMKKLLLLVLLLAAGLAAPAVASALTGAELAKVVGEIDERQRNQGDWKALCYMEQKEKGKTDVVYELLVFRRDQDDKQMFLFTKPKAEAGKGYLRIEKNLWLYDPSTGRWERRTERERIGGTNTRRGDLDESKIREEYDATWEADEKLGVYDVHRILLKVKPGIDVAYPIVRMWVDTATTNVLKRQDLALSGRLMRTIYEPRWKKIYSPSKKADVWYPEEIRIFDEIEKGNSTLILIKEIDLRPLEANLFTKAWLESRSR